MDFNQNTTFAVNFVGAKLNEIRQASLPVFDNVYYAENKNKDEEREEKGKNFKVIGTDHQRNRKRVCQYFQ